MGSDPDLSAKCDTEGAVGVGGSSILREGSLNSLTSTYFTAEGGSSLNSSLYFSPNGSGDVGELGVDVKMKIRGESLDSNSTLEGDSLASDVMGSESTNISGNSEAIEVREDISKICNAIAEKDEFGAKKKEIEKVLRSGRVEELRELAISNGGLVSNALRTRAWPLLLNVSPSDISKSECKKIPTYYPNVPEKICNLVHLDVARVLKRFPPGLTDPQQDHLQMYLSNLICTVLQENKKAYYYQGFHDISLTFLLVSISQNAPYLAFLCLNKMIETNLDPYMEKTMERTHDVIHVLFALLEAEDPILYKKIVIDCKCPVAFCLPWVLTWYSHTLPSDTDVFRLYDFVLGSQEKLRDPYLIPIFISAALLLRSARNLKEDKTCTDIAAMHQKLSKLPSELESQEPWLKDSSKLMEKYRGKEDVIVRRGIEIKAFQNRLWNEDNNNRPSRTLPLHTPGLVLCIARFFLVRHRWTTASFVILGAAFFLQTKYGRWHAGSLKSIAQNYAPTRLQYFLRNWLIDESTDE